MIEIWAGRACPNSSGPWESAPIRGGYRGDADVAPPPAPPPPLPCPFPAPFPAPRLRTPARLAQVLWPPSSPRAWPEPRLRRLSGAWGWLDSPCVGGCALAGRGQRPWPWPGICGCRPAFLVGLAGEGRRGGFWCGQSPGPVTSCRIRVMAAIGTRCCCRRPASPWSCWAASSPTRSWRSSRYGPACARRGPGGGPREGGHGPFPEPRLGHSHPEWGGTRPQAPGPFGPGVLRPGQWKSCASHRLYWVKTEVQKPLGKSLRRGWFQSGMLRGNQRCSDSTDGIEVPVLA